MNDRAKQVAIVVGVMVLMTAAPAMADTGFSSGVQLPVVAAMVPNWVFQTFDYVVLSLLGLASIAGIALAIDAVLHVREKKIAPPATTERLRTLIAGREFKELMDFTATDQTFVSRPFRSA